MSSQSEEDIEEARVEGHAAGVAEERARCLAIIDADDEFDAYEIKATIREAIADGVAEERARWEAKIERMRVVARDLTSDASRANMSERQFERRCHRAYGIEAAITILAAEKE